MGKFTVHSDSECSSDNDEKIPIKKKIDNKHSGIEEDLDEESL